MQYKDIYELVKTEEPKFRTSKITPIEGWDWGFYDHVRKTTLYKNSHYTESDDDRPFKNIIRPILNVQYRAEGFDVKDVDLYLDESENFWKSFITKKYHYKWATENEIDTFIDELVESYVDYGGSLLQDKGDKKPEVIPLISIAFCDQTDLMGGPLAIKHYFSPNQLLKMKDIGWGNEDISLEALITISQDYWKKQSEGAKSDTTGKQIEVYEVHGEFPKTWLGEHKNSGRYDEDYAYQMWVVSFYQSKEGEKKYQVLYKGLEDNPFDVLLRDPIKGRALGLGGAEELFHPQVWTNLSVIRMGEMLDQASKVFYKTTDKGFAKRQNTKKVDTGSIFELSQGTDITKMDNSPINLTAFENAVAQWQEHAQMMGAANEAIMGEEPKSGTPFALQELITAESHSLHDYRKGKIATFLGNVYRKRILPHISKEITKDREFLSELDADDIAQISEKVAKNRANDRIKEKILSGEAITEEKKEEIKAEEAEKFRKEGNRQFIKILKDEFKGKKLGVKVSIINKQKNLPQIMESLVNVFRQIISAPQVLEDPKMEKLFFKIIEYSGLDPVEFQGLSRPQQPEQQLQQPTQNITLPQQQQ